MTFSSRAAWALGLGLIGAAGLVAPSIAQQPKTAAAEKPAPAVIGCVDMEAVVNSYDECKVLGEKIKAEAISRNKELTEIMGKIQQIGKEMSSLAVGSPEFKAKDDEGTRLQAQLEAEKQKAQRDFAQKEAESMAEMYKKIQAMVRACAIKKGMTYVVRVSNQPLVASNPESVMSAMARPIVFSDPSADITQMVVVNLNAQFARANPGLKIPGPATTVSPATTPTPAPAPGRTAATPTGKTAR